MERQYFFKILMVMFIFMTNFYNVKNNLIGIDLGTEFFKATILRPGRPFTMLENIQSKTKTPTSISLKDDERVFGADAIAKKPRIPKNVLTFFHEYLAKSYNSDELKNFIENYFISYDMEEDQDRQTVQIKMNFNNQQFKFSTEEIFGMLFRYIKFLADKFTNSDIKDCVVTVPNFFGYKERQAIVQAVELSKLNLLGLVNENVGAAVQFSMNKNFNNTEHYIFYNMGSSYTQATLVSFLSNMQTKNNKTVEVSKTIKVLDESWDKNLGGNVFNYNLVKHLMKKFDEMPQRRGKNSVLKDYRVAERILPGATKYKEILSANKDVPVTILGVESGMNLETRLTREEFEEVNLEDINRSYTPIEKLLNRTGITLDQISQIELLGGSIRVPKVQDVLKLKLGDYSNLLGTHMNGDDSMAFGTAYICANFSSNFKASKIELYHGPNYEIKVKLRHSYNESDSSSQPICDENFTDLAENCIRPLNKNTTLYKVRRGLDTAKTVSFKHDGDFEILIYQKFEDSDEETLLVTYKVEGVQEVLASMKYENILTPPKVVLRFKQDARGLLSVKAEVSYEINLYLTMQTGPTGGTEFIFLSNFTAPLTPEELSQIDEDIKNKNITEDQKSVMKMRRDVGRKKTQDVKKDLKIDFVYTQPRPLTKEEIKSSIEKLNSLDEIDKNRIKTMEKRNALETMIYSKREWLESSEVSNYAKESEVKTSNDGLQKIADWFDESGYSADFNSLNTKFNELNDLFKNFDLRKERHINREKAIENFHSTSKKTLEDAIQLVKTKPWVESHYNSTFLKEYSIVQIWFTETKEKQDKLKLHEDPVLISETIEAKAQIIKREYYFMSRIPKPKPQKTEEDIKFDDMMKNSSRIEDLIKKANLTMEDIEKMADEMRKKNETGQNIGDTSSESNTDSNKSEDTNSDL